MFSPPHGEAKWDFSPKKHRQDKESGMNPPFEGKSGKPAFVCLTTQRRY